MSANLLIQETEILSRVIGPANPTFTPEAARSILQLRFSDEDTERVNALAAKARDGTLSEEEESLLHAYLFAGAVVDLMHSKARLSLKQSSSRADG